jgi:hypothetical protein
MSDGIPRNPPRDRAARRTTVTALCVALVVVTLVVLVAWVAYPWLPTWARVLLLIPLFVLGAGAAWGGVPEGAGRRWVLVSVVAMVVAMGASVFLGRALAYHSTTETYPCVVTASDSWSEISDPGGWLFNRGRLQGSSTRRVHLVEWDCAGAGTVVRMDGVGPAEWDVGDEVTLAYDSAGRMEARPADRAMGLGTPLTVVLVAMGVILMVYLPALRDRR